MRTYNETVKCRYARNFVGIWLAVGLISLASCAPPSTQVTAQKTPTIVGSTTQPETHLTGNAPVDTAQSTALTNYLHSRQLPLVGARVLASNGGPRQAILYGYVGTPFGKADAVDKTRQWLNDSGAQVDNRIKIEPDLVKPSSNPNAATADNDLNNPDIQKYENQQHQELTQQQQQYMNQGSSMSSGLMMVLPFLMLGGGFGGGGSGFSFGGGGFGSPYSSPYGSPYGSPYNYPSTPPPTYGSPYGP